MDFESFKIAYQKAEVTIHANEVTKNPLVSICVQTYQHAAYIKACLDGILMQKTSFPFEVLLGEDASSDETRAICIDYAQKHPDKIRLFLHKRENNIKIDGAFTGRFNLLYNLYNAQGKYIAICEGDDFWVDDQKLEKQVTALQAHPDINICSHRSIKYDEGRKKNVGVTGNNGEVERIVPIQEVILKFAAVCPMQTIMLRNQGVDQFIDLVIKAYGAHGLMQVFWAHPKGVLYLPEAMAVYRVNVNNSATKTILANKLLGLNVIMSRLSDFKALDKYFNFAYSHEFQQIRVTNLHSIVRSGLIPFKEKLKVINENKNDFSFSTIALLLFKSTLSKLKHSLVK